ncbi:MAG TPA: MBL fold metallo-hydrolase [Candidatus Dormibacteraeota bacterium]|nr:MBL fold metallo-hydrolase [Candidatus Dormibacteraeota bacterium]
MAVELADLVELQVVVDPTFDENCYVLRRRDTDRVLVVDPGLQGAEVVALLARQHLVCERILATHGHPDHTLGVPAVQAAFPEAPLLLHRADWPLLERSALMDLPGLPADRPPVTPAGELTGGQLLDWQGVPIEVRHTPGHTLGSVTLVVGEHCWSGDTLFRRSVGRTDLPGGSWPQLVFSIRDGLFTLPAATVVYPGHGARTTVGEERLDNPFVGARAPA